MLESAPFMSTTRDMVEAALRSFVEPALGSDLISAKAIKDIQLDDERDGGAVRVTVELGFPAERYKDEFGALLAAHLGQALDARIEIAVSWRVVAHAVQQNLTPLPGVRNIVAVASGKGGVGKSTVAANLALALAAEGARVGVLDADIYGPSQPRMLGITGRPLSQDGKRLAPMLGHGLQCMSIGFLIDEEQPMVWRGPMVTQALTQLLNDT